MAQQARIVVDCRWLDSGGSGRVTELLLRGLARDPGDATWVLWGPGSVERWAWPGAEVVLHERDPRQWNGQRDWFDVPPADLVLFLHQQRPQRAIPAVSMVHDTIPLRFASGPVDTALKRLFLKRLGRISRLVLTPSESSRRSLVEGLGLPGERVEVVRLPADPELAARVAAHRRELAPEPVALYLGLFLPHKNLSRLVEAFAGSAFRAGGGRLLLVGGLWDQAERLVAGLNDAQREFVEVMPFVDQPEVERLLATCRFLVLPSLEEGFGLPAWEALTCGVPVCVSDAAALTEIVSGWAEVFPAASVDAMRAAIDRCAAGGHRTPEEAEAESERFLRAAPTIDGFAACVRALLEGCLTQL